MTSSTAMMQRYFDDYCRDRAGDADFLRSAATDAPSPSST